MIEYAPTGERWFNAAGTHLNALTFATRKPLNSKGLGGGARLTLCATPYPGLLFSSSIVCQDFVCGLYGAKSPVCARINS